jgi:hypothetical protein
MDDENEELRDKDHSVALMYWIKISAEHFVELICRYWVASVAPSRIHTGEKRKGGTDSCSIVDTLLVICLSPININISLFLCGECRQDTLIDDISQDREKGNKASTISSCIASGTSRMASSMIFHTSVLFVCLLIVGPAFSADLCKWYGIAPFCFLGNSCPDGCFFMMDNDKGDGMKCWVSVKKYCCCPKRALDSLINSITSGDKKWTARTRSSAERFLSLCYPFLLWNKSLRSSKTTEQTCKFCSKSFEKV